MNTDEKEEDTPTRRVGKIVSVIGLMTLGALLLARRRSLKKEAKEES